MYVFSFVDGKDPITNARHGRFGKSQRKALDLFSLKREMGTSTWMMNDIGNSKSSRREGSCCVIHV